MGEVLKKPDELEKIRKYILGEVGEDDRSAIEQLIMTDDDYFQKIAMVEESLIQDYVDENLEPAKRARFEKCFLISAENKQKVRFARALRKYVDENEISSAPRKKTTFLDSLKAFLSSPVPAALMALIILGFGGFFVWKYFTTSTNSEVLIALNKAYRAERPFESRITDLDYAPLKNTRGGNDSDKTDKTEVNLADALALKAVSEKESAENLHTLGRVYLTEKKFDEAIGQFEKAAEIDPQNAKLHNDLGVALMEKAGTKEEGKLENLAKANEHFAEAIESDKTLLDAYFNQALVIQELNLPNQAKESWQKYLDLDSTSPWAEEARKNLKTLDATESISKTKEEVLREFLEAKKTDDHEKAWQILSRNREMITGKLIPQQLAFLFVDAKSNGDEDKAKEFLDSLIYAGKLEEKNSGDLFWRDLADFYANNSDRNILSLKQSQIDYIEAAKLESVGKLEKSIAKFESASKLFYAVNNVWIAKLSDYWIGSLKFRLNQLENSEILFNSLTGYAVEHNYKWLATHSYVRLTFITGSRNDHSQSIEYGNLALKLANQTNDYYNLQRIFYSLSYNYRCLKRYELSFDYSNKAFEIVRQSDANPTQLWDILDSTTKTLFEKDYNETAIIFQKEALHIAEIMDDKFAEHLSKIYLGMLYTKANKFDSANRFFNESRAIAENFEDFQAREKGLALINLKQANLERLAGNYQTAINLFRQASEFYVSSEFHMDEYESGKGELLCYFALKDDSEIQNHIPVVLDIFKHYRSEILEEQNRNSFFDKEQDVYDLAINYEYEKGNEDVAFDYSENSRARSLLDLLEKKADVNNQEVKFTKQVSEPFPLKEIRRRMPENTQIVQYSVLNNKLLIWVIGSSDFFVTAVEISNVSLNKKTDDYLKALAAKDGSEKLLSNRLYDILIKPVLGKLDASKQICIVSDKFLFHLPFAALLSTETQKYLINDFDLLFSPSVNVFLVSTDRAKKRERQTSENILLIGNPSFGQNSSLNRNLPKLPDADQEVRQIKTVYPVSSILTGKDANKDALKKYFPKSDVIHFAGHYIVDEVSPMESKFVLTDDETLNNRELFGENLEKTKLIVLSACQTGVERFYQGEGMLGASRTLLAKGIPVVVASQWNVDSEAASKLMILFHKYRKNENISSVHALRKAQIELLSDKDKKYQNPYHWAAFQVFGGDARF